jgi:hypothetical protein
MKYFVSPKSLVVVSASILSFGTLAVSGVANAAATNTNATTTTHTTASTQNTAADQQKLSTIISKGDQEISRRLTTLATVTSKISAATKLSASDKSYLSEEVSTETSGLTALKTKLDAETTLAGARTDAQSIVTDYRVYALIVPKIQLIKTADDQQVSESKLSALVIKLQSRLTAAKANGKDITALQAKLDDMNTQTSNAQAISSAIESKVLTLQPTDYDSDHSLLSGDAAQLKTAHSDNTTAYNDAKSIVAGIKNF